ncbi:MAG: hypothetical protein IPG61_16010 [bacterium]|nr:hypothetical protein [bacterium]
MRLSRYLVVPAIALLLILGGCGGGDDGPNNPGGGGGGGGNSFTAVIDGVNWTSDEASISVSGINTPTREGMLIVTGFEASSGRGLSLAFSFFIGPASQPLGVNTGTTPGGTGTVIMAPDSWMTPLSGQAGFITLSARTATRVAGTFNFTAAAVAGAVPATRVVTGGTFDITKDSGLPPLPTGVGSTAIATIGGVPWYAATIIGLGGGGTSFTLAADNTSYSITLSPKQLVSAGNTYGIPSQMGITVLRTGTADSWWGGLGADIGSITITTLTTNRVVATFNGNLVPLNAVGNLAVGGGAINAYLQ